MGRALVSAEGSDGNFRPSLVMRDTHEGTPGVGICGNLLSLPFMLSRSKEDTHWGAGGGGQG